MNWYSLVVVPAMFIFRWFDLDIWTLIKRTVYVTYNCIYTQ